MNYQSYSLGNIKNLPQLKKLTSEEKSNIEVVSRILPFKTNNYVVNELINWDDFSNDPMFILNFPQKQMLSNLHFQHITQLIKNNTSSSDLNKAIYKIRMALNPNPAGQLEFNIPTFGDIKLNGIQHKYKETMLFFPSQGQTCHAYCTFCFRWPQFSGISELKFAMKQTDMMLNYLTSHPTITDILFTGGDPMVMSAKLLESYINPLLTDKHSNLRTIRIGTKSLSFWPYRYTTDKDADDVIKLFEKIIKSGKHLAIMAHFNHPRELETPVVQKAIQRIRNTGAVIRTQSPILNHINANSNIWAEMWKKQVNLGLIPYYMFVPRETGSQKYFALPLVKQFKIYRQAYSKVSGICRSVRGPSMSTQPGKVVILGLPEINNKKTIALTFIQARNSSWVSHPFFAKYNDKALWLNELEPADGNNFFFETSEDLITSEEIASSRND